MSPYEPPGDAKRGADRVDIGDGTTPRSPSFVKQHEEGGGIGAKGWISRVAAGALVALSLCGAVMPANAAEVPAPPDVSQSTTLDKGSAAAQGAGATSTPQTTSVPAQQNAPVTLQQNAPVTLQQNAPVTLQQATPAPTPAVIQEAPPASPALPASSDTAAASTQSVAPAPLPEPSAISRKRMDRVAVNAHIDSLAAKLGMDPELVKAVAWQESNWIHTRGGKLTQQDNIDSQTGAVKSTDLGIMQINSKAHPKAYPKASTIDGNLEYGAKYLKSIVDQHGDGPGGIWRYNGDPEYGPLVCRHREVKPWAAGIMRDHLAALRQEKSDLAVTIPRTEKELKALEKRVELNRQNVDGWQRKAELSKEAAKEKAAEREAALWQKKLETSEKSLEKAQQKLVTDKARLEALPGEIDAAQTRYKEETNRVAAIEAQEYTQKREQLTSAVGEHAGSLGALRRKALDAAKVLQGATKNAGALEKSGRAGEAEKLKTELDTLRARITAEETAWKTTQSQLQKAGKKRLSLPQIQKKLKQSRKSSSDDEGSLKTLRGQIDTLAKAVRSGSGVKKSG